MIRPPVLLCLSCAVSLACSNTVYDFFPGETTGATSAGSGGDCSNDSCGTSGDGSGASSTGIEQGSGGETTDTGVGMGGQPDSGTGGSPASCISTNFPYEVPLVALRFVESGNCLAQGEMIALLSSSGYATLTGPCTQSLEMSWVVLPFTYTDGYRNEATNRNLDVRFSAPEAETPLVLFDPHAGTNQRFQRVYETDDGFLLAPLHTTDMCLQERNNEVVTWPCDSSDPSQRIELVNCEDLAP